VRHAIEDHHAIGKLRVLLAEWSAREREHACVFGRFDQRLQEKSAHETRSAGDQGDFWRCAHAPELNKCPAINLCEGHRAEGAETRNSERKWGVVTRSGDAGKTCSTILSS